MKRTYKDKDPSDFLTIAQKLSDALDVIDSDDNTSPIGYLDTISIVLKRAYDDGYDQAILDSGDEYVY